jgi:hypothetical protein
MAVVGDEVDSLLNLETGVSRLLELEAAAAALEDGRLDVRDGSLERGRRDAVRLTESQVKQGGRRRAGKACLAITSMCAMTVLSVSSTSQYDAMRMESVEAHRGAV